MRRLYQFVLAGALAAGCGSYTKLKKDLNDKVIEHQPRENAVAIEPDNFCNVVSVASGELSAEEKKLDGLEKLVNADYKIINEITRKQTLLTKDGTEIGSRYAQGVLFGSAFNFARDGRISYFGTAAHCLPDDETEISENYSGLIKVVETTFKQEVYIVKYEYEKNKCGKILLDFQGNKKIKEIKVARLRQLAKDDDKDAAILIGTDLPEEEFKPYNFFVDRDMLRVGQEVYAIGYPHAIYKTPFGIIDFSWGKHVSQGIITNLGKEPLPFDNKDRVFIEATLSSGMSGGSVGAVMVDGVLRIAGINSVMYPNLDNKYGFATGILELAEKNKLTHLLDIAKKETRKVN
ncbi:trypsin-like peptidase domain-containing protein [Candidatus Woesearchaeota archaeon]|nr:trypsin-like peptidase domain-containing protein [Candidatus Woesearchaeota archaeon]